MTAHQTRKTDDASEDEEQEQTGQEFREDLSQQDVDLGVQSAQLAGALFLYKTQSYAKFIDPVKNITNPELAKNLLDFEHPENLTITRHSLKTVDRELSNKKNKERGYAESRFLWSKKRVTSSEHKRAVHATVVARKVHRMVNTRTNELLVERYASRHGIEKGGLPDLTKRLNIWMKENPGTDMQTALAVESGRIHIKQDKKYGRRERDEEKKKIQEELISAKQESVTEHQHVTKEAEKIINNTVDPAKTYDPSLSSVKKDVRYLSNLENITPEQYSILESSGMEVASFLEKENLEKKKSEEKEEKKPALEKLSTGTTEGEYFDEIMGYDDPGETQKDDVVSGTEEKDTTVEPSSLAADKPETTPSVHDSPEKEPPAQIDVKTDVKKEPLPTPPQKDPTTQMAGKGIKRFTPFQKSRTVKSPLSAPKISPKLNLKSPLGRISSSLKPKMSNLGKKLLSKSKIFSKLLTKALGALGPVGAAASAIITALNYLGIDVVGITTKGLVMIVGGVVVLILFLLLDNSSTITSYTADDAITFTQKAKGQNSLSWSSFEKDYLSGLNNNSLPGEEKVVTWSSFVENNLKAEEILTAKK